MDALGKLWCFVLARWSVPVGQTETIFRFIPRFSTTELYHTFSCIDRAGTLICRGFDAESRLCP